VSVWLDELDRMWPVKRAIVLCHNVRDLYLYRPTEDHAPELLDLAEVLSRWCSRAGAEVTYYDPINRFTDTPPSIVSPPGVPAVPASAEPQAAPDEGADARASASARPRDDDRSAPTARRDLAVLARMLRERENTCVVVRAAEWLAPPKPGSPDDRAALIALESLIGDIPSGNRLILVYLNEEQIPSEVVKLAPRVGMLNVPDPSRKELRTLFADLHGLDENATDRAVNLCFGMTLYEIDSITRRLGGHIDPPAFEKAVRRYRFGDETNYWSELSLDKLRHTYDFFVTQEGVQGQDEAVDKVQTVLIRARADIQRTTGGNPSRPRGALFFAGPTGVGKTLMAQKVAKFLFGDEAAMVRIDMSEYSQEHQVARLYGAPPGYIGYEHGGTLTNAVERNPFCVVLFDEIEKAHPRVFDIFLQILGDGRLTDSRGTTVRFSETFIAFTSNLGADTAELVDLELLKGDRERRYEHFIGEVETFFTRKLGRPELLNRIGRDNIVVFNYIDSEETGRRILAHHLRTITEAFNKSYAEQAPRLRIDAELDRLADHLYRLDAELITSFGGREVENLVNRMVRDRLAEYVLEAEDRGIASGVIRVTATDRGLDFALQAQG
jgi:hypothetical protein